MKLLCWNHIWKYYYEYVYTAINVGPNGELEEARIVWGEVQLNNEYTIFNGTGNNGKVKILSTGQSIDISNGFNGKTTGVLSTDYNKYKGELLCV